jgi:2-amino-4-hydroxy-6-hydroxymethyldihydropteridine diphosphokinase
VKWIVAIGSTAHGGVQRGIDLVRAHPDIRVISESDIIITPPFGGVTPLPFQNAAIVVESPLSAAALLSALHAIEALAGRVRSEKNAARALDLDLVWGLDLIAPITSPAVPHPRALERSFVVIPAIEALERAGIPIPTSLLRSRRACPVGASSADREHSRVKRHQQSAIVRARDAERLEE